MMVDLPEPEEPDERGDGAGRGLEADAVQDRLVRLVGEGDVVEGDVAVDAAESAMVRCGSSSSARSLRISRVRSRPASASVSWVPMRDDLEERARSGRRGTWCR